MRRLITTLGVTIIACLWAIATFAATPAAVSDPQAWSCRTVDECVQVTLQQLGLSPEQARYLQPSATPITLATLNGPVEVRLQKGDTLWWLIARGGEHYQARPAHGQMRRAAERTRLVATVPVTAEELPPLPTEAPHLRYAALAAAAQGLAADAHALAQSFRAFMASMNPRPAHAAPQAPIVLIAGLTGLPERIAQLENGPWPVSRRLENLERDYAATVASQTLLSLDQEHARLARTYTLAMSSIIVMLILAVLFGARALFSSRKSRHEERTAEAGRPGLTQFDIDNLLYRKVICPVDPAGVVGHDPTRITLTIQDIRPVIAGTRDLGLGAPVAYTILGSAPWNERTDGSCYPDSLAEIGYVIECPPESGNYAVVFTSDAITDQMQRGLKGDSSQQAWRFRGWVERWAGLALRPDIPRGSRILGSLELLPEEGEPLAA